MSRNGSGTQTSPAGSFPVANGDVTDAVKFNNVINDINTSLTQSIANNGETPILANIPMSGFKFTNLVAGAVSGDSVEYAQMLAFGASAIASAFASAVNLVITAAGNLASGAGQIYLNGTGSNRIDFNSNGSAAPSFTTRSLGTKITLLNGITSVSTDMGFGIESVGMWSSVPTTGNAFKWYGGTTVAATLSGTGQFTTLSDITSGASLTSTSPTGGVGYATGAGGSITQGAGSGKATGVTLNKICGVVLTDNAALAAGATAIFLVTNSTVAATDYVNVGFQAVGTNSIANYSVKASTVTSGGAFYVALTNVSAGILSQTIQITFNVVKSVNA
jgi:hypothetical protein